jgi:hypothetical protein
MRTAAKTLRTLARALVRYAAKGPAPIWPSWHLFMERQLEEIRGDAEALIWAVGCVWAFRVERLIGKFHPSVNCALFLVGLYLTVNYLLAHLAWYGLPSHALELTADAFRGFAKGAISIGLVALVGLVTPGSPRRRLFAAGAFPLLGSLGLLATMVGMELAYSIRLPAGYPTTEAILLRGPAFGLLVAAPLALPSVLLYRATAAPMAILALIPAIAKAHWVTARPGASAFTHEIFLSQVWPFLCALIYITIFTSGCSRWLCRALDGAGHPPAR